MLTRLILVLSALVLWAGPVQAAVDWNEGFEYTNHAALEAVWPSSCPGNTTITSISTTRFHSGAKSLKKTYNGHQPNNSSCWRDRSLNAVSSTLFVRYWMYMDNFTVDYIGTKISAIYSNGNDGVNNGWGSPWFEMLWGNPVLGMNIRPILLYCGQYQPTGACPTATVDSQNIYGGTVPQNQWVCVEAQLVQSSPGVDNGVVRQWINGTPTLNITTQRLLKAGQNPSIGWEFIREYVQDGVGTIYIDDYAVDRSARIGCGSTPPPPTDTVPPGQVTSLVAVANGGSQVTLTWVNGTDANGVTGQNIRRCTGTSCTPSAILIAKNGINTSHVDTTVAAGTVYGYSVADVDAAGNIGAYSSTVYVTTPTTYRNILGTDLFNRADGLLGATWDDGYTTFYGANNALALVSNQLRVAATATDSLETYNAVIPSNDQWAQITLSSLSTPGAAIRAPGVLLRANALGNLTGYACRVFSTTGGTTRARIERWDGVTAHVPLTPDDTTTVFASTDKMRCEAEGTTIRMYRLVGTAETLLLTRTDATYASGRTGIIHYVASGTTADVQVDDFLMGSISSTPATTAKILTLTNPATRTQASGITYNAETVTIRVSTEFSNVVEPLSAFPGGVYTYPASVSNSVTTFIGIFGQNAAGVESTNSDDWKYVPVPAASTDTTAPVMSGAFPSADLPFGTTASTIGFSVNEPASCRIATTNIPYASMTIQMDNAALTHSYPATGLVTGANSFYRACADLVDAAFGGPNVSATVLQTVTVAASTADVTPPGDVGNLVATALSQSQVLLVFTAASGGDVAKYQAYLAYGAGNTSYKPAGQPVETTTIITSVPANTVVNAVVKAIDTSNNYSTNYSNVATVTTTGLIDVEPPSTMANLRVYSGPYTHSVKLTSDQGTDNLGSVTTTIEISPAGCAAFNLVYTQLELTHFIQNLQPATSYCARGKFADAAGNVSTAYSNTVTFTTTAVGLNQPRAETPFGVERGNATHPVAGPRVPRS